MNNIYKTTKFSVTSYGRTTTVEVDHADVDMEEFLDIVKVMAIGMTFHEDTWKRSIIELGAQYEEEMREEEKEVYQPDPTLEKAVNDYYHNLSKKEFDEAVTQHNVDVDKTEDWDVTLNDGLEEDDEFDDYGMRIPKGETMFEKAERESKHRWEEKKEWREQFNKETAEDCEVIFKESMRVFKEENAKKKKDAKRK